MREIGHRLGVDLRRVPLQQDLEIGGALAPGLAALPPIAFEIIGGGGEYVGDAVNEIAAAVAVVIDGVFEIGRRQELGLANLAGPSAAHFAGAHVAAVDDAQRIQELGPEFVRAAAIVGQRRQRAKGRESARVGAEVGFEAPDGDNDRARHSVLLLDAAEDRAVLLKKPCPAPQPGRHHAAGKLLEALVKDSLRVIARDDRMIIGHRAQRRLDRALGNALRRRLLLDPVEPGAEVAAAGCRRRAGRRHHRPKPQHH